MQKDGRLNDVLKNLEKGIHSCHGGHKLSFTTNQKVNSTRSNKLNIQNIEVNFSYL